MADHRQVADQAGHIPLVIIGQVARGKARLHRMAHVVTAKPLANSNYGAEFEAGKRCLPERTYERPRELLRQVACLFLNKALKSIGIDLSSRKYNRKGAIK